MVIPEGTHDVGRSSECWLTLDDELSSRVHARFIVDTDHCAIEDLGSRNGTHVNGDRIEGEVPLNDGDRVRIGRELMTLIVSETEDISEAARLRQTLAPGEMAGMPTLMSQLIEKALKVGKTKEAERYAMALHKQLAAVPIPGDHPAVRIGVQCLRRLAEHTGSGSWIDKLFMLCADQRWILDARSLDEIRVALDRIPRVPGQGMRKYEQVLKELVRDGADVPSKLVSSIGELADAYGGR